MLEMHTFDRAFLLCGETMLDRRRRALAAWHERNTLQQNEKRIA
jgi:hypothetical protein